MGTTIEEGSDPVFYHHDPGCVPEKDLTPTVAYPNDILKCAGCSGLFHAKDSEPGALPVRVRGEGLSIYDARTW